MNYTDEKIVPLKMKQIETSARMSLEDGYFINGILVKFSLTELFDNKILIYIPDEFVEMPSKVKEIKYPSTYRPQIIKTNLAGNVNFLFNMLENPDDISAKEMAHNFHQILTRTNPAIKLSEILINQTKQLIYFASFDCISYGVDEQIYNAMCFFNCQGKILQCVFNCSIKDKSVWKNVVNDVFINVRVTGKSVSVAER